MSAARVTFAAPAWTPRVALVIALLVTLVAAVPASAHPDGVTVGNKTTADGCPGDRSVRLYFDINFSTQDHYLVLCGNAHKLVHGPIIAGQLSFNDQISAVKITNFPYASPGKKWVVILYYDAEYAHLCLDVASQNNNLHVNGCGDIASSIRWAEVPA